jgi:murein DD-endopeptidase MepM/ murein hydrolase activator NlpD
VLIMHPGGWDTVYAHLDRITVSNRSEVRQGEVIGAVGATGDVDQAQLHFETRYSSGAREKHNPVDPLSLLPQ